MISWELKGLGMNRKILLSFLLAPDRFVRILISSPVIENL